MHIQCDVVESGGDIPALCTVLTVARTRSHSTSQIRLYSSHNRHNHTITSTLLGLLASTSLFYNLGLDDHLATLP